MPDGEASSDLVGRDRLLDRLRTVAGRVVSGQRVTVLVAGEAGIGKTSLLRAAAEVASAQGAHTAWGTCVDIGGAPGYWPWTQALGGLVREIGADGVRRAVGDDVALLAPIVPDLGRVPGGDGSDRDRFLAMEAVNRLLSGVAQDRPVVVVLDDLQWADDSSLALFDFLAHAPHPAGVGLIGAYRPDELAPGAKRILEATAIRGELLQVDGLDVDAVQVLLERVTGRPAERGTAEAVHRRSGGHPFFVRELALAGTQGGGAVEPVPAAVRGLIERRVARLPAPTIAMLEAAALVGSVVLPDVVAAVLGVPVLDVDIAATAAVDAGVLTRTPTALRFSHDLLREAMLDRVELPRRIQLHGAIGAGLEARGERGHPVEPGQLAHHFLAAIGAVGPDRAARWALRAAADDCAALAFGEAAGHLRRLRAALAHTAVELDDRTFVEVLLAEAGALARAGSALDADGLLRHAGDVAARAGDAELIAQVALARAQLGARFATRRDEIIRELQGALTAVEGAGSALEAQLTATLARELQHSVPEDRPRAGPLSERALELSRRSEDPATLLSCLLARHDVLWNPGAGVQREEIAGELAAAALGAGDRERHAEGLLLLANAQLEQGSPAFQAALESWFTIIDGLGQPRHRYMAETRRACLALLRGDLDEADERIERAAALGERLLEPDTGNVRMSQRLELVRARNDAGQLRRFAADAVAHWTGAPVHSHAVAAGFLARAGDLDAAAHHVATVLDLGTWRSDRSYLWSVFVRELAHAAVALEDRALCQQLLEDVEPLAASCGVNGAVVAFAGSHAHTAGLLAAALGRQETARALLEQAATTYRRLGAAGWASELVEGGVSRLRGALAGGPVASMRRRGQVWDLAFAGRHATIAHTKGLGDIFRLVAGAGTEVHVLDLVGADRRSTASGTLADGEALRAYRRRLADLDADIAEADGHNDPERRAAAEAERDALLDEVRRVTGTGGTLRQFANHPAERARKATSGRIRDAIRKLEPVLPELAAHLDAAIVTGTYCRYRPDGTAWHLDDDAG